MKYYILYYIMSSCPKGYYCFKENLFIFSLLIIFIGLYFGYTFVKNDAEGLRKSAQSNAAVNREIVNRRHSDEHNDWRYNEQQTNQKNLEEKQRQQRLENQRLEDRRLELQRQELQRLEDRRMEMLNQDRRRAIADSRRQREDLYLERINNPLVPPEETYVGSRGVPINIPTRGEAPQFQQIGYINNSDQTEQIPLYGRQTYPGSNKWNYYTANNNYSAVKMPIQNKEGANCMDNSGCRELNDSDTVSIPGKGTNYNVHKYNYNTPRYIPYI